MQHNRETDPVPSSCDRINISEILNIHLKIEPTSIGKETIRKYVDAVEDNLKLYEKLDAIPPNAIAAYVLRELLNRMCLPPGTIHASQEIESFRIIPIGKTLYCNMTVSKPTKRKGLNTISAEFVVQDIEANNLLCGKSLVLLPGEQPNE